MKKLTVFVVSIALVCAVLALTSTPTQSGGLNVKYCAEHPSYQGLVACLQCVYDVGSSGFWFPYEVDQATDECMSWNCTQIEGGLQCNL